MAFITEAEQITRARTLLGGTVSSILDDGNLMEVAAADFTETYARIEKDTFRLKHLFNLMDICRCGKPFPQTWEINKLVNDLKTIERYFKKAGITHGE